MDFHVDSQLNLSDMRYLQRLMNSHVRSRSHTHSQNDLESDVFLFCMQLNDPATCCICLSNCVCAESTVDVFFVVVLFRFYENHYRKS